MEPPPAAEGARKVLLIVDDEPEIRDLLLQIAARSCAGFEVLTAGDVSQAETIMRHHDVRAILTDVRMPGRSGLHLLRLAPTLAPRARCALMTGYQEDVLDGTPLHTLGAITVLRKPFRAADARELLIALTSGAG